MESPRFDRMWAAAIGAATEYGFQVIELNETQGVITAARTGPGEDNALLRMYIYPSAAGYTVAVVVRSPETAALPPVVPPRTARREPLDRSSRYTRLDNAGPIRHFEEEERLLEGIRRRLAERAEKEK